MNPLRDVGRIKDPAAAIILIRTNNVIPGAVGAARQRTVAGLAGPPKSLMNDSAFSHYSCSPARSFLARGIAGRYLDSLAETTDKSEKAWPGTRGPPDSKSARDSEHEDNAGSCRVRVGAAL